MGDVLLYAVLSAYAEDFGLTLPWVGVLLSAEPFVRMFAYGLLARLTQRAGVRRICIAVEVPATASTALYGFGQGPAMILAARMLWGQILHRRPLLITQASGPLPSDTGVVDVASLSPQTKNQQLFLSSPLSLLAPELIHTRESLGICVFKLLPFI